MRLTIFGSTGATGSELVRQAAAAGHHVIAVARRPEGALSNLAGVEVRQGDVLDEMSVTQAIAGSDAVLFAIGSRNGKEETNVYSEGATHILRAMREVGVRRFVAISAEPVSTETSRVSPFKRFLVYPILYRFFGGAYRDMKRMESVVAASDRDWTIYRPPQLTNRQASGRYRTALDAPLSGALRISRADLAAAMLDAADDPALVGHIVTIAE